MVGLAPINVSEHPVSFGSSKHVHFIFTGLQPLGITPSLGGGPIMAAGITSSSPSSASFVLMFPDFSKYFQSHYLFLNLTSISQHTVHHSFQM